MCVNGSTVGRALIPAILAAATACSSLPNQHSVVVDDYEMTYAATGEGSPVVVFESGFGASMANWSKVFPQVATFSTVFAYDRRGYEGSRHRDLGAGKSVVRDIAATAGEVALDVMAPGVSTAVGVVTTTKAIIETADGDDATEVRTAAQVVEELRTLLTEAGLAPPYVLVGHSLGGLYTLYFAKTYPHEVAGIVLVDSSHPEQLSRCRERYGDSECDVPALMSAMMKMLPDEIQAEFRGIEESGRQVIAAGDMAPIPLTVLSRGKDLDAGPAPIAAMWPEFQQELAAQVPNSTHITAGMSGHFIQQDEPQLVINAIEDMVIAVREREHGTEFVPTYTTGRPDVADIPDFPRNDTFTATGGRNP